MFREPLETALAHSVAELVDNCCRDAHDIVAGLRLISGVEVLAEPVINQGLVSFPDPDGTDHDRHTDRVIAAIQADGEAYFGGTTWHGMRAMHISVSNCQTDVMRPKYRRFSSSLE